MNGSQGSKSQRSVLVVRRGWTTKRRIRHQRINLLLISGWKGMGKTSFLSYLKAKVKSEKIMVSYMLATAEERPFFLSLLSGIFRENRIFKEDKVVSLIKENLRTKSTIYTEGIRSIK